MYFSILQVLLFCYIHHPKVEEVMIIRALDCDLNGFRYGSVKGAVSVALDGIPLGESLEVEAVLNSLGRPAAKKQLAAYVAMLRGNRRFHVKQSGIPNGLVAVIYRIK